MTTYGSNQRAGTPTQRRDHVTGVLMLCDLMSDVFSVTIAVPDGDATVISTMETGKTLVLGDMTKNLYGPMTKSLK